jgi:hypothetical protein
VKRSKKDREVTEFSANFTLIDDIFIKIAEKEKRGTESLSEEQQILGTLWHVYGIIGNGVIVFSAAYFRCRRSSATYETVGMPESAAILR